MAYVGLFGYVGMMSFLTKKKTITNPLQANILSGHWLNAWATLQVLAQKKAMLAGSARLEFVAKQILSFHGWRFSHRICNDGV